MKEKTLNKEVTYQLKGRTVVISEGFGDSSFCLDIPNLIEAIENVKRLHSEGWFKTEEAYEKQLDKYEGALNFAKIMGVAE